jgi:hypothetical protein
MLDTTNQKKLDLNIDVNMQQAPESDNRLINNNHNLNVVQNMQPQQQSPLSSKSSATTTNVHENQTPNQRVPVLSCSDAPTSFTRGVSSLKEYFTDLTKKLIAFFFVYKEFYDVDHKRF